MRHYVLDENYDESDDDEAMSTGSTTHVQDSKAVENEFAAAQLHSELTASAETEPSLEKGHRLKKTISGRVVRKNATASSSRDRKL